MKTPFKMKGWSPFTKKKKTESKIEDQPEVPAWKKYTKVKDKPIEPSTTKTGDITGSEATETKSPDNPYPYGTKQYYRWEADYAESIKQGQN